MQSIEATLLHLPIDWVILGVFAIFLTALTLRSGTRVAVALSLSLPVSLFIINILPGAAFISSLVGQLSSNVDELVLFAVVFVVLYVLVFRMLGSSMMSGATPVSALIAGIAGTIVAVVFWLQISALGMVWHFDPQIQSVFGGGYRFWWLLLIYIALAFTRS